MSRLALGCFTILCLFPHPGRGGLIDDFDNGVVADSDSTTGYWGIDSFGGGVNGVSESNSLLTFAVGDNDGSNESNFGGVALYSNAFQSDLAFLDSSLLVRARGIGFLSNGSPHVNHDQRHLRFGFVSSGTTAFAADDAVFLRVFETGVSLRTKLNEPNANGQGTQQANLGSLNGVGGFDWQIGPGTAGMLDYDLTAYFPSGAIAGSTSGSFAYDASQWNQPGSASRFLVMAQELNVTGGDQHFSAMVDSLSVSSNNAAVPEPSSLVLCSVVFVASFGLYGWRTKSVWSVMGGIGFISRRKRKKV